MKTFKQGAAVIMACLAAWRAFSQTNLQFTAVAPTDEQAIRLTWASVSHELYEIDEADALNTNADGTTAWNMLYSDYPSQGTNTFWLDTGNYNLVPQILHPKYMPMRFYRISDLGPDTTSDEPSVTITSPTNGVAVSGELTITVLAYTDQPVLSGTKLYVDGQEMQMADSTTNYTIGSTNYEADTYSINTCEWGNETHTLFATAECDSGYGVTINSGPVSSGHAVSPFVPVLFSNLVTRISFSQPSFDPTSGQIQQVSAAFTANCNWTLTVRDVYSNAVRTVTGAGTSMSFNWDGTGNGGTSLPAGIYYYYISAQTNGGAFSMDSPLSESSGSFSAAMSVNNQPTELWAMPADGSAAAVPLSLYPPGFDTNDLSIFEAPMAGSALPSRSLARGVFTAAVDGGGGAAPDYTGTPSQPAPPTPQRPPYNPVRGLAGTFGIGYDTYSANGTNGITTRPLQNEPGINGSYIQMESFSAGGNLTWPPRPMYITQADTFVQSMHHFGWSNPLNLNDGYLNLSDLRGSGTPFNNVTMGVLILHGTYGSTQDYEAGLCKQMYFPIGGGSIAQYLRFSEMNLGGSGTNGLKWMAISACHSLYHVNWSSMQNMGIKPYNSNLHLILGADTDIYTSPRFWWLFAEYMNYGTSTNAGSYNPLTIRNAWYQSAQIALTNASLPSGTTVTFAVAGDTACLNDMLQTNSLPGGNWTYDSKPVYP